MDKTRLFQFLSTQEASFLLDLLDTAYDEMNHDQRQAVFGRQDRSLPPNPVEGKETLAAVEGKETLAAVERFHQESQAGVYYAPFEINSKNWMHIPKKTQKWFERLGDLLQASTQLTAQGEHEPAVLCFGRLYELIEDMEEFVFGEEIGSWMIPGDGKQYIAAYMTSLALTATPEKFTERALPLIRSDSWQSFVNQAYAAAIGSANEAQKAHLEAEIRRQKIHTKPTR